MTELTDAEFIERYTAMSESLMSDTEISTELGRTHWAASKRAKRLGCWGLSNNERAKRRFINDYRELAEAGVSDSVIASRFGLTVSALRKRIDSWDCRVWNRGERVMMRLVDEWRERGQVFTSFDFPEWVPDMDRQSFIKYLVRQKRVRRVGCTKVFDVEYVSWLAV